MSRTLKELITEGYATLSYNGADESVTIIRKQFNTQTGEEELPQKEQMSRVDVEYYIAMREQQLEDLQEILKAFTGKVVEK